MRIAIFGQKEHGKTTTAKFIQTAWKQATGNYVDICSLAYPLKMAMSCLTGMTINELDELKDQIPTGWKQSPRDGCKKIGDVIKEVVHPDILTILALSRNMHFIIDDGRTEKEARKFQNQQVFNVLIYRPDKHNYDSHNTESWLQKVYAALNTGYDAAKNLPLFDVIIWNNSTLDNLRSKIIDTVIPEYRMWVGTITND